MQWSHDYNKFLNEALLLKSEIENKITNGELNKYTSQEYLPKMKKFKDSCKIMYDNIIKEAKKFN